LKKIEIYFHCNNYDTITTINSEITKMGASLGHLVIYCFNIDKMEVIFTRDSIDYAAIHPIEKAKRYITPNKLFEFVPTWKDDKIIYAVSVPLVYKPICSVLDNKVNDDIINDTNYRVTARPMENEGRFFQDEKYNVFKEPYIQEFTLENINQNTVGTYNYFDFACLIEDNNDETKDSNDKSKPESDFKSLKRSKLE
jgi:hypothetical protein